MSQPQPTLRPTEPATLVVAALGAAALSWVLISNFYQDLPPMTWPAPLLIALIAAGEAVLAQRLWARIQGRGPFLTGRQRPDGGRGEPVHPLVAVRFALLGKASALAGALLAGFYFGFVPWLAVESGRLVGAAEDLPPTVGGVVASAALLVAGWLLERACRIPGEGPGESDAGPGNGPDRRPDRG